MSPVPHVLQFLVVAVAGWINQQPRDVIDSLQEEHRVLREQLGPGRLRFTDAQRRRRAAQATRLGRRVRRDRHTLVGSTMICRIVRFGSRTCSAARCVSSRACASLRASALKKSRWARGSPLAAATHRLRMIACCIDTVTVRSPSRTGIRRAASSSTICASGSSGGVSCLDVVPFGRPLGLPTGLA